MSRRAGLDNIIQIEGVSKRYEGRAAVVALDRLDLAIGKAELVSIIGPSGSGKSTLLNLIGTLDQPSTGDVVIDGQSLASLNDHERTRVRRQILGELAVMTSMAVAVAAVLVAQVPLISPFYWVETHVYVLGFIMAAGTIYLVTLLCGWYPSRLATRIEPAEALRYE